MEINFIHCIQILIHLHVDKTNFHMKGFLSTRTRFETEAKGNSEIAYCFWLLGGGGVTVHGGTV